MIIKKLIFQRLSIIVADPFHFDSDPDPRILLVEKLLFITFFSSEYTKNYLLLYKKWNINSNEKYILIKSFFYLFKVKIINFL